jgi:hypothetical protein
LKSITCTRNNRIPYSCRGRIRSGSSNRRNHNRSNRNRPSNNRGLSSCVFSLCSAFGICSYQNFAVPVPGEHSRSWCSDFRWCSY